MAYIDGFLAAVKTSRKDEYKAFAEFSADVFKDHGALGLAECWGEDVPDGKLTSFPMAVKLEPDETVVFSWIRWPDKESRDKGLKAVFADERMAGVDMPFDGARMIFGGFELLMEA
jgi:uncharacterized protein YbaA (DUF1428 family)